MGTGSISRPSPSTMIRLGLRLVLTHYLNSAHPRQVYINQRLRSGLRASGRRRGPARHDLCRDRGELHPESRDRHRDDAFPLRDPLDRLRPAWRADPRDAGRAARHERLPHIRHAASGYRRIRPSDTALVHADHRAWLEERLAAPFPGRTVVVTHHCPHPGLISQRREELDPAYGSNLLPTIERFQPETWLFGHTQRRAEAEVGRSAIPAARPNC
ncbi:hypothetical protein SAMN05444389_102507 [Paracoccus solventivorans]|uniref:Calcineurin-like phosphoesterase n=1 Tax=Paracoccus solventivorans TaxID=53463 RepID=A0A1M7F3F2_9RHOB|nr:hypothetical protein SAMN05444389_102507 [Paracoccus solventivorans]